MREFRIRDIDINVYSPLVESDRLVETISFNMEDEEFEKMIHYKVRQVIQKEIRSIIQDEIKRTLIKSLE